MYDCLEIASPTNPFPNRETVPASSLHRRFIGRNWARLGTRSAAGNVDLARAREVALFLDAELHRVDDGSIAIVGLSLNELLSLNERFGQKLIIEAVIAISRQAH